MGDVTIIDKKRIIKNLKVYGAVIVLSASSYHASERLINSSDTFDTSIEYEYNIDELDDYVLQGLCKVDDRYLLSAYDNSHGNSILYVLDDSFKRIATKELDTSSHVGGITYDEVHDNIWITDKNGSISAYDKADIMSDEKKINSKYNNIYVGEGLTNWFGSISAAYITYYNNRIYVGNYNISSSSIIKEYNLNDDGTLDTSSYNKYNVSQFVQGITFYEKDGVTYLITSSSFGQFLPSKLQIYDFSTLERVKAISTKKMMEEIIIDDDKLITLYEANAKIYRIGDDSNDIIVSDLNKILTK